MPFSHYWLFAFTDINITRFKAGLRYFRHTNSEVLDPCNASKQIIVFVVDGRRTFDHRRAGQPNTATENGVHNEVWRQRRQCET